MDFYMDNLVRSRAITDKYFNRWKSLPSMPIALDEMSALLIKGVGVICASGRNYPQTVHLLSFVGEDGSVETSKLKWKWKKMPNFLHARSKHCISQWSCLCSWIQLIWLYFSWMPRISFCRRKESPMDICFISWIPIFKQSPFTCS